MSIITNIATMSALNSARINSISINSASLHLTTAKQINYGAEDPSGLGISKVMKARISGLSTANQNAQDTINYLRVRDSAMAEVGDMIQRIRDLAVRAANDATLTDSDRNKLADEAASLIKNIDKINSTTKFNGIRVFNVSFDTVPAGSGALVHPGQVSMSIDLSSYGPVVDIYAAWYNGLAAFPDLNLISPDGTEAFGYLYDSWEVVPPGTVEGYLGGATPATINNGDPDDLGLGTMNSATSIDYSGWMGYAGSGGWDEESFRITNPMPGMWTLIVDNESPIAKNYGIFINEPAVDPTVHDAAQIGPDNDDNNVLHVGMFQVSALSLGVSASLSTVAGAQSAITSADSAIATLNNRRADTGVMMNRLDNVINDNMAQMINTEAGRSGIEDAQMASEITKLTKTQIVQQVNMNTISNANNLPENALELLKIHLGSVGSEVPGPGGA